MESQVFRKADRLLKRPEFQRVMGQGRKRRIENLCTVLYLPNQLDRPRLGIIASKKIGNAVVRNRAKRKIREIFRCHKRSHPNSMDIVVICGKKLVAIRHSLLESKLQKVLGSL